MKAGPKFKYDPKILPDLILSVAKAKGSMGQVADLNKIPRNTFKDWMKYGERDKEANIDSEFAQLSSTLRKQQAEVVTELVSLALSDEKKTRFIIWWLPLICREDFGVESEELKQLKDLVFNQILPLLGKGVIQNGGRETEEMDSESSS